MKTFKLASLIIICSFFFAASYANYSHSDWSFLLCHGTFFIYFQILLLYLQNVFGPRFFIPKFMQPNYFSYDCKLKMTEDNSTLECTICIQNIFEDPNRIIEGEVNNSELHGELMKEVNVMKTPCNHYFHKECLIRWIDVKLECPTCRMPLPPM